MLARIVGSQAVKNIHGGRNTLMLNFEHIRKVSLRYSLVSYLYVKLQPILPFLLKGWKEKYEFVPEVVSFLIEKRNLPKIPLNLITAL